MIIFKSNVSKYESVQQKKNNLGDSNSKNLFVVSKKHETGKIKAEFHYC